MKLCEVCALSAPSDFVSNRIHTVSRNFVELVTIAMNLNKGYKAMKR